MKRLSLISFISWYLRKFGLIQVLQTGGCRHLKTTAYMHTPLFVRRSTSRVLQLQESNNGFVGESTKGMEIRSNDGECGLVYSFDSTYYDAYAEAMERVITSFRVKQKKDTEEDLEAAKLFLFSPSRLVKISSAMDTHVSSYSPPTASNLSDDSLSPKTVKSSFHDALAHQRDLFIKETQLTQGQRQLAHRALTYMGDYCAKTKTSLPLYVAWEKIKESGISPRDHTLSAYLYSLTSLESMVDTTTQCNPFTSDDNSEKILISSHGKRDISGEVAIYHDRLYQPTENTASIQIKMFIEQGKLKEAERILSSLSKSEGVGAEERGEKSVKMGKKNDAPLKLRTFLPVLNAYCEQGDASSALRLYESMLKEPSVYFEDKTYSLLISSLAKMGCFKNDSPSIKGIDKLQLSSGCGPKLFDEIASQMANDILEISSDCAKEIRNSFVSGFAGLAAAKNLFEVPYDCNLAPVQFAAKEDELVACRVTIEQNNITCPRTNVRLRLILLEQQQKKRVYDTLLQMADTQFEAHENMLNQKQQKNYKGKKAFKPSAQEENFARKHLESFAGWLDSREGKPFTAIVDGANVAYYGLGSVNYHHISLMVKTLENMGENPLVIIPQKYAQKKFYLRQGYVQELHSSQVDVLANLEEKNQIYRVPARCLDDYYWMLSSVSRQSVSSNGANLDVPPHNEEGRWPGTRPMLITNDQMRDHKLELLDPRLFRRWSSSYIVNYDFPPLPSDRTSDKEITFQPADFFSREIQCNRSNGNDHDIVWHFPVNEWDRNDRFCVRIPKI